MSESLHTKLSAELESKEVFAQAQGYAYEYMTPSITSSGTASVGDSEGDEGLPRVFPSSETIAAMSHFDEALPVQSSEASSVLEMLETYGTPATVRSTGGRYFGFVNGGVLPVSAASRWMSDVWDQNCALQAMSPIASKLEEVVEGWMVELLGLEPGTALGLVGGSSVATLCGIAAARNSLLAKQGWDVAADGLFGAPPMRVVISEQAHGSVYKALSLLGLGKKRIEKVPSDKQGRIRVDQLPPLDETTLVILQAGHVSTGAYDDFDKVCDLAKEAHAWVHIDGAFGLWAAASSKLKHLTKGFEKADSWCADAHKTLNAPYDCGIVLCKDRQALKQAMAAEGSYLQESQTHRDGMFYTPDMSRRSRSVDLWVTLKYLGQTGVEELVNGLVACAQEFGNLLSNTEGFLVLNEVVFNQCLVKCRTAEETTATLTKLQASGLVWCGGTQWEGEPAIRISCCSWATTLNDVRAAVKVFDRSRRGIAEVE